MDDILKCSKRKDHIGYLKDLFKANNKEWFEDLSKKVQIIQEGNCVHGSYHQN